MTFSKAVENHFSPAGWENLDDVAFISKEKDEEMSNGSIFKNDVILNITVASIGRCFYVPLRFGKSNVNQHIATETKRIDGIITKIVKEISLVQEYRTGLISEVVTGKIKVC